MHKKIKNKNFFFFNIIVPLSYTITGIINDDCAGISVIFYPLKIGKNI